MVKIVYNDCYGGFDLSTEGKIYYAKLLGYTDVKVVKKIFDQVYVNGEYFSTYKIPRTDPALIQTIEDLGSKADGPAARLRIREVPAGSRYRIEDYDGLETVMLADEYEWRVA